MRKSKTKLMCGIIPSLVQLFKRKRLLVDIITIRFKCVRNNLIIHIIPQKNYVYSIRIIDVINKKEKIFRINSRIIFL